METLLQLDHRRQMNAMLMEDAALIRRLKMQVDTLSERVLTLEAEIEQARLRLDSAGEEVEKLVGRVLELQGMVDTFSKTAAAREQDAENPDQDFVRV
jgi:molecular chaperone GrpE (heat shock protein)